MRLLERVAFSIVLAALCLPCLAAPRVLVFFDENKDDLPGLSRTDRSLREAFRAQLGTDTEVHSESIGLSRAKDPGYEATAVEFYRRKYESARPDLIVAVLDRPLAFLMRHSQELFPGVPIVFSGIDASSIEAKALPPNVTGLLVDRQYAPTLDVALRLQPEARNVVVVGGTSPFDRFLQGFVRRDLKRFEGRLNMLYLFDSSMDEVLARVAALPPRSIVLFVSMLKDAAGNRFVPAEALASIATKASAPTYVFLDQYVGLGAVGGNVYSYAEDASHVVALGARILRGEAPSSIPVLARSARIDVFDERQLRRWKLDESRLPAGSVVRNRQPSVWDTYRWYIVAAVALLLVQGTLIAGLLIARRRQRLAEAEARKQRDELAHVLRVTTLNELTTSLAHEINQPLAAILLNAQAAMRLLGTDRPTRAKDVEEALTDIVASADHASGVIGRLRALFRKESIEPRPVDVRIVIGDVVKLLHAAMLTESINVRLAFEEPLPFVLGDPVQLEQVLLNVVRNACDAIAASTEATRVITIRARQARPGYMAIEVSDTGIGVAGNLETIFEHFASTKPNGLGMGLAISRSIVGAHGGLIWATPNEPRGLTIHIELVTVEEPRRGAPQPAAQRTSATPSP